MFDVHTDCGRHTPAAMYRLIVLLAVIIATTANPGNELVGAVYNNI